MTIDQKKTGATLVDELVASQRKVAKSEEAEPSGDLDTQFKALVNNIPGMVYRGLPDRSIEIVSCCEEICGYSMEDFDATTVNWLDLVHPEDKEHVIAESTMVVEAPDKLGCRPKILDFY